MEVTPVEASITSVKASITFMEAFVEDFVEAPVEYTSTEALISSISSMEASDPGYGRGVPFWAVNFSGLGSLARVTPLILCDLTFLYVLYLRYQSAIQM